MGLARPVLHVGDRVVFNRTKRAGTSCPNLGVRLGLTALLVTVLVLIAFLAVVVAGPLFGTHRGRSRIPGVHQGLVGYLRWPIGVAALLTAFAIVYALGPTADPEAG